MVISLCMSSSSILVAQAETEGGTANALTRLSTQDSHHPRQTAERYDKVN